MELLPFFVAVGQLDYWWDLRSEMKYDRCWGWYRPWGWNMTLVIYNWEKCIQSVIYEEILCMVLELTHWVCDSFTLKGKQTQIIIFCTWHTSWLKIFKNITKTNRIFVLADILSENLIDKMTREKFILKGTKQRCHFHHFNVKLLNVDTVVPPLDVKGNG